MCMNKPQLYNNSGDYIDGIKDGDVRNTRKFDYNWQDVIQWTSPVEVRVYPSDILNNFFKCFVSNCREYHIFVWVQPISSSPWVNETPFD